MHVQRKKKSLHVEGSQSQSARKTIKTDKSGLMRCKCCYINEILKSGFFISSLLHSIFCFCFSFLHNKFPKKIFFFQRFYFVSIFLFLPFYLCGCFVSICILTLMLSIYIPVSTIILFSLI